MKITIQVTQSPLQGHAASYAFHFVRASLEQKQDIIQIFFYGEGIYNANLLASPDPSEINLVEEWSHLGHTHDLSLVVCSHSAIMRGVRDSSLAPGFRLSGLGQFVTALAKSDRIITFGTGQIER